MAGFKYVIFQQNLTAGSFFWSRKVAKAQEWNNTQTTLLDVIAYLQLILFSSDINNEVVVSSKSVASKCWSINSWRKSYSNFLVNMHVGI